MNFKETVLNEIAKIEDNDTKLYSYLYDLAYDGKANDLKFLEKTFSSFLNDKRNEIKRVSIYGLLFALKIRNERYKKFALKYALDTESSFNLRLMCMSALAEAYMGLEDIEILSLFFNVFKNEDEDEDIRAQSFIGMMKLLGISSAEITRQNQNTVIISFDDINLEGL